MEIAPRPAPHQLTSPLWSYHSNLVTSSPGDAEEGLPSLSFGVSICKMGCCSLGIR